MYKQEKMGIKELKKQKFKLILKYYLKGQNLVLN